MKNIKFGKKIYTKYTDNNGSISQRVEIYRGGQPEVTTYYEERIPVKNETEELAEFIRFLKDKKGLNRAIRAEMPQKATDHYYLVKCWEE